MLAQLFMALLTIVLGVGGCVGKCEDGEEAEQDFFHGDWI